jgi:hypothetical protein
MSGRAGEESRRHARFSFDTPSNYSGSTQAFTDIADALFTEVPMLEG